MRKNIYKKNIFMRIYTWISPILLTLAVALMIFYALQETERASKAEGLRILENSIRRAVVKCYAATGSYPESMTYIEENYGIYIDKSKYLVDYNIFASNILPSINVMEIKKNDK